MLGGEEFHDDFGSSSNYEDYKASLQHHTRSPECLWRPLKVSSAMLQPVLHFELEQVSKIDILRKLKKRFGAKTIRDVRFRVG
jgi:hypothetical protein